MEDEENETENFKIVLIGETGHLGKSEGLWFLSGERDGADGVNAREIGEPVEFVVIVVTVINPMQWAGIREV